MEKNELDIREEGLVYKFKNIEALLRENLEIKNISLFISDPPDSKSIQA